MARWIATLFGVGYLRPAPGTWGSAVTVLLVLGLHRLGSFPLVAAVTALAIALGFWAIAGYTRGQSDKDRSEIVIDEVAGQMIALCATSAGFWHAGLPPDSFPWPGALVPFLLFRLFDIWKPGIIGRLDRRSDAAGVMLDDIAAGVAAAVGSILLAGLYHGLL